MCYLNGWHPFESIRFDLVEITLWRCLILQIWEQQKQLLQKQRVIQLSGTIAVLIWGHLPYVRFANLTLAIKSANSDEVGVVF